MTNIKDVLAMTEEEQVTWVFRYAHERHTEVDYWHNYLLGHISLADLAVRLRNEAKAIEQPDGKNYLFDGYIEVFEARKNISIRSIATTWHERVLRYFAFDAEPIDTILAALKAMEK